MSGVGASRFASILLIAALPVAAVSCRESPSPETARTADADVVRDAEAPRTPTSSTPPAPTASAQAEPQRAEVPEPEDRDRLDAAFLTEIDARTDALRAEPRSAQRWYELGESLHRAAEYAAALACYERSAELDEAAPQPRFLAAIIHAREGEIARAIARMQETTVLAPTYAPAYWRLGLFLLEDGKPAAAAEAARQAAARDPSDPSAPLVLARAYLQLDDHARAAATLEHLLAQQPDHDYARQLLSRAYRGLNQTAEADRLADLGSSRSHEWTDPWLDRAAPRLSGDANTLRTAVDFIQQGMIPHATNLLESLAERLPNDIDVAINLGLAYRRAGRFDEAIDRLHHALSIGEHEMAHLHLAGAHRERAIRHQPPDSGEIASALHHAGEVIRISPGYAPGHAMLGEVLILSGDLSGGLDALAHAGSLDPTNPIWPQRRGIVLAERGRWHDAVADFRRFLDRESQNPVAYLLLGTALANSGDLSDGLRILDAGLAIAPDNVMLLDAARQLRAALPAEAPAHEGNRSPE